ncbi:uncharacterized protein LOC128208616 [Mya arenaria]|uniref:uncharacterized protein LOC128208616 n=1 Tax=Mya arenaria TaxID=6604 RepID=UPI0022E1A8FC|nr:uncharacterized protein LOC128208616 [Mya arenaria]
MDDVEERVRYEEEEFTTIHRKMVRTHSTTRRKKAKDAADGKGNKSSQPETKLSPFIIGAKARDTHYAAGTPPLSRKSDRVQKLVQETLNEYKGKELPQKSKNPVFFGALDSDEEEEQEVTLKTRHTRKWSFTAGNKGVARFRKLVEFVILARHIFTCRRSVSLSRRDSILFFLDRQTDEHVDGEQPKFDVNAFKSLGQKTKMASVRSCLDIPPPQRTDAQINHMVHTMRGFSKFSNYPQAVQTGLCKRGWYAKFESTRVIVKEGCKAEFYYLILSGVAVYRDITTEVDETNTAENKMVASYLKPGDALGEREILTGQERPATVVCKEPVEVLGLDRDSLLEIFNAAGGLGSIEFLRGIPELSDFPLELLKTYHFSMAVHNYRRGAVVVKNTNDSEWVYIVRSGSCQVYKAIKDARKERRQMPDSRPASGLPRKKERVGSGLVLPNIHKLKQDVLKCASLADVDEISSKKRGQHPGLERSHTLTLPSLSPGNACLVHRKNSFKTPNIATTNIRRGSKELSPRQVKKLTSENIKLSKGHRENTPDILRLSRNDSIMCETPEPVNHTKKVRSQSPSSESMIHIKLKKESVSSGNESVFSHRKQSNASDSDNQKSHSDWSGSDSPRDTIGSTFYVRLGTVMEKGVFGLHQLIYEDMPNLSLVSHGAECVLISKQFLKDHLTKDIANRLRMKLSPYPSSGQLRNAVDDQLNWENYRERVITDVLK